MTASAGLPGATAHMQAAAMAGALGAVFVSFLAIIYPIVVLCVLGRRSVADRFT